MSPRPDVRQTRRRQILDAAAQVFTRKGFDQARMDDLVAVTGLSKGSLYWHFKSKREIVLALIDRLVQLDLQQPEALSNPRISAVEAVRRFTDECIRAVRLRLRQMPLTHEFLALAFRDKAVQRSLRGQVTPYVDLLAPLIQRGINTGEFRRVEPGDVAIAAGAIVEGTLLLWAYDGDRVDPPTQIRSGIELLLRGLAP